MLSLAIGLRRGGDILSPVQSTSCTILPKSWHIALVWGHGIPFYKDVVASIQRVNGFQVEYQSVLQHYKHMRELIETVYDDDIVRVGASHIDKKTQYLLSVPDSIGVLVITDSAPRMRQYGTDKWVVRANENVVDLKWSIRRKYNPKLTVSASRDAKGVYSHNHVIHVSDTSTGVDQILRFLQLPTLEKLQRNDASEFFTPWFLKAPAEYAFEVISLHSLYVGCAVTVGPCQAGETVPLSKSPHVAFMKQNRTVYSEYYNMGLKAGVLTDDHTVASFQSLLRRFRLEDYPGCVCGNDGAQRPSFIIVDVNHRILDGAHRAAILFAADENARIPVVRYGVHGTGISKICPKRCLDKPFLFDVSSSDWASQVVSKCIEVILSSVAMAIFKASDTFPEGMKNAGEDVDILVDSLDTAVAALTAANFELTISTNYLHNGTQAHLDLSDGHNWVRLDLYERFHFNVDDSSRTIPEPREVLSSAVNSKTAHKFPMVSFEDECHLRWLEWKTWHKRRPEKVKHLIWNANHGCTQKWIEPIVVQCSIEVPKGSWEKREVNGSSRSLSSPMIANYGFVPGTHVSVKDAWRGRAGDGDPADCIVIGDTGKYGDVVMIRIQGIILMKDDEKIDFKVVGTRLDIPKETIPWNDLIEWFSTYKPGVTIDGIGSVQDAIDFLVVSTQTKP
jgi:inorganic pyrophosphatase